MTAIREVDIRVVHPPNAGFQLGTDLWIDQMMVLVTIRTDDGVEGTAGASTYGSGLSVAAAIRDTIAPLLLGSDPWARELIADSLFKLSKLYLHPQAAAIVDCALWDWTGRATDRRVCDLLGLYRRTIPAYASLPTYSSIEEYLDAIEPLLGRFPAIKLHVWGDVSRDVLLCTKVREMVGPEVRVMVDAAGHYDFTDALRIGHAIEDLDFEWFEMPIEDPLVPRYATLAKELRIPVTTGEVHRTTLQDAAAAIYADAWDIVRIDACNSGGITAAKKTAGLAEAFGLRCELHSWGFVVNQLANLHVALAVPNCRYFEMPVPVGAFDYGMTGLRPSNEGEVSAPALPGLGQVFDADAIEHATVSRERISS